MTDNRLVITWQKDTSATTALSFTSARDVAANYGYRSAEAGIARTFFASNPGRTISYIRYGMGQRPHIIGGNIDTLTIPELQAINGTLDVQLTIPGVSTFDYAGTVDMAGAQSFADAAVLIAGALDANLPVAARTTGDTLTSEHLTFQGYVQAGQASHLYVTALDANNDPIVPGGIVSGAGITPGSQIISQLNGTPGGVGEYDLFGFRGGAANPLTSPSTISETYGLLDVGSVTAGQLSVGERIQPTPTNGIPALTAIAARAADGQNWIVNNAVDASGALTMTAPGLDAQSQTIVGTKSGSITNQFFDLQPDGHYGLNFNPSTIGAVTGTAADALGLSAAAGAIVSSPGGQHFSIAGYMHRIINNYTDQLGNPISFGSFQSEEPRLDPLFSAWTQTPEGSGYTFLSHTTAHTLSGWA